MATSLHNYIPSYPTDPNTLSYDIAKKKEFNDLRLGPSENVPDKKGELLQTQLFMQRFFSPNTPYDSALLYHGLGSGKTCTASAIIEASKNTEVNGKRKPPALVIVKNEDIARNVVREISEVCTSGIYTPEKTDTEERKGLDMSKGAEVIRLNKKISQSYKLLTFESFLKKLPSDEKIKKAYSNRIIILDEAHTLRIQSKDASVPEAEAYEKMHRFLHTVDNCRIILLTGTPIWDKTSEIASLMNLILPLDKQLPTGSKFDKTFFEVDGTLKEGAAEEIKGYFRGRVHYLRQMVTTAERQELGTTTPWLKYVTVYPDVMSETQTAYAKDARDKVETKVFKIRGKNTERETKGGTVLKLARDAMNMIIPVFDEKGNLSGADYGPSAFEKHAVKRVKRTRKDGSTSLVDLYQIDNPRLRKELKDNLAEYSAKFASIIHHIKSNPKEVVFIYNENVTGPGGAIMLGLCLQIHGFSWAKSASDISKTSPTKRFAVITSYTQTTSQPKQIQELLDSANRPDNKYGDRLQIIIGSEKISMGISIKNVRQIHIVMPHWNIPAIDQAKDRGFRFGGHDALPKEERNIKIFRHVAVEGYSPEAKDSYEIEQSFPERAKCTSEPTTDIYIYKIAEEKEHKNTQIFRLLKEVATDCAVNYNRNVLPEDVDGTRDCDYQECNYQCDGFPYEEIGEDENGVWDYSISKDKLDVSSYNLLYSNGRIRELIDSIIDLFKSYFSIHFDNLIKRLGIEPEEEMLLLKAIDIIIDSRTIIRNLYGFPCYLKEQGNIIFLDKNISSSSDTSGQSLGTSYPENVYIESPFIVKNTSMDDFIDILELDQDKSKVLKFCRSPSQDILDKIGYKTKIIMMEAAFVQSREEQSEGQSVETQQTAIELMMTNMGHNLYEMSDGRYVHILYTQEFKGVSYDVAAKNIKTTGMMRYFDPSISRWRYLDDREKEEEYVKEIKDTLTEEKDEHLENNPYGAYGWISKKDNTFRINLKPKPGQKGKIRGRKCAESFQVPDLVDIFVSNLDYLPEVPDDRYDTLDKDDLIRRIKGKSGFSTLKNQLEDKDEGYLKRLLYLLTMRTKDLCGELKSWFESNDLMFSQ